MGASPCGSIRRSGSSWGSVGGHARRNTPTFSFACMKYEGGR